MVIRVVCLNNHCRSAVDHAYPGIDTWLFAHMLMIYCLQAQDMCIIELEVGEDVT